MADNTTLDPGVGGDTIRDKDRVGVKTPIVALDLNPAGAEALMAGAMPVTDNGGSLTVDNAGTFAVQDSEKVVDNAAFTDGTTKVLPVGYVLDEVAGTALTENDAAAARVDSKRAQVLVIEDETTRGQRATVTAGKALKVDGSAVTQPVSGTVTATGPLTDTQLRASAVPVDSELPAAAALADASANPTAPAVGAFGLLWNGATWDRAPGGATNGLTTNLKALNGTTVDTNSGVKSAGTLRTVLATDQPQLTNALKVDGSAVTQPVSGNVTPIPATSGGLTPAKVISAASTNATSVKGAAGQLYVCTASNTNASPRYLKLYDKATAPTVGTDIPKWTFLIPGNASGAGTNIPIPDVGVAFANGIALALTTGVADADTGAVAANEIVVNLGYK